MLAMYIALGCLAHSPAAAAQAESIGFWIGADLGGIYAGHLNSRTGEIEDLRAVVNGIDAYYIARHPSLPVLYAAIRTERPSQLAAYQIETDGTLKSLGRLDGRPHGVSQISVSPDGRYLAAAYYRTGITGVYTLNGDGSIRAIFAEVQHQGRSVTERQEAPHPHWTGFSEDARFLYVPDLGTDQIWVYTLDSNASKLHLVQQARAPAGAGPRHMAIHPTLNMAYVSDEFAASVSRYALDRQRGTLRYVDTLPRAAEAAGEREHTVSDIRDFVIFVIFD